MKKILTCVPHFNILVQLLPATDELMVLFFRLMIGLIIFDVIFYIDMLE